MNTKRKNYTPEFKLKVVMESMQRDTTQEEVCKKFGISSSMIHRWRKEFQTNAQSCFHEKRDPKQKAQSQGYEPGESPDDLKKIIGELTVQNAHSKKSLGADEEVATARDGWNWRTSCVGLTAPIPKAKWQEHSVLHEEHSISKESKPQKTNR